MRDMTSPVPTHASLFVLLVVNAVGACTCGPVVPPPPGDFCGTGTIDGAPWALDSEASRAVIVVHRKPGAGCGLFHSHVVSASIARVEYELETAALADGTVKVTIAAAGLDPDAPELRAELLPDGENGALSEGDRRTIRGSVAEEVRAAEHPELVFTFSGLSATDGAGKATMRAEMAGAGADHEVEYAVTRGADRIEVKGSGKVDGAPYGMPRNSLGFCVEPTMDIVFDLALVPSPTPVECKGAPLPAPWQPTIFDDDSCADAVGYNDARQVAVRSCAGCHGLEPRLGATVPLVEWEDWRRDSIRHQGRPLYETAHAYVHRDPSEGLSMPPVDLRGEPMATPLTVEERALFDAWIAGGARRTRCTDDPGLTTFDDIDVPTTACDDTIHYETPDADGNSAQQFFEDRCAYCHLDAAGFYPQVPQVGLLDGDGLPIVDDQAFYARLDHAAAARGVLHPWYLGAGGAPLSFWEASVLRVEDHTMPPSPAQLGLETDPAFLQFKAWVQAGAPPAPCASAP